MKDPKSKLCIQVADLEAKIISAKNKAYLRLLYDNLKSKSASSLVGNLEKLGMLSIEWGRLQGEARYRAELEASPEKLITAAAAPQPTITAAPATPAPMTINSLLKELEKIPQNNHKLRAAFFETHKDILFVSEPLTRREALAIYSLIPNSWERAEFWTWHRKTILP